MLQINKATGPWACVLVLGWSLLQAASRADEPTGELAQRLTNVTFDHYAEAPGYSEGPTWRDGEVFFCSGSLLRVTATRKVHKEFEIGPAGTVLLGNGHLLICDNQHKALLDFAPDGRLGVVAERFGMEALQSLNDLTIDARGNVYWTDPEGSSLEKPIGRLYRVRPDGRVDRIANGLAFPNGIEVDPANKFLYVIESQSKQILRYPLPPDNELLGEPEVFYDLGGSGGDGCAFDAVGNLWVADFHRPDTKKGRITVLSPDARVLAYLPLPSGLVSNIAFGGVDHDEIFCTTGDPPGVFHAKVGVKGFAGHPGKPLPILRPLNVVQLRPHPDAETLRQMSKLASGRMDVDTRETLQQLTEQMIDPGVRADTELLLPDFESASDRYQQDQVLKAEIKRLGGNVTLEVVAPEWLRSIASDSALPVFSRIVELELNERTDGHQDPEPKTLADRVTDDWLKQLAGQDQLRRLELSGTAVTSSGLMHLQGLTNLERLNVCLTACDDRGLEYLAGMTRMKRMTICASKITGTGFAHLQGMQQLESINLHSAPASDRGLEAIGKLTSLKRLEIVHTQVTDVGLQHLAGLVHLQQLHVHGPETTPNAFPFLGQLQELVELDIYDRAASNLTLEQIASLPRLRKLMLLTGIFDDNGVQHLANVTTLEELTLDSSGVTDASVAYLGKLSNLRQLHLGPAKLSATGRQQLASLLPKTVITP